MKAWLRQSQLVWSDVALAIVIILGIVAAAILNYEKATENRGDDAWLLQIVTTHPLFPGVTIGERDVALRLRPKVPKSFSYADQVIGRRVADFIDFDMTITEENLDSVAAVSGHTTFVVKMSPTYSVNAAPGTWITLVRGGKAPPTPIGLFHVCSRIAVETNADAVTLEACQMADAIAVLSQGTGTSDWIPIPVPRTQYECSDVRQDRAGR